MDLFTGPNKLSLTDMKNLYTRRKEWDLKVRSREVADKVGKIPMWMRSGNRKSSTKFTVLHMKAKRSTKIKWTLNFFLSICDTSPIYAWKLTKYLFNII